MKRTSFFLLLLTGLFTALITSHAQAQSSSTKCWDFEESEGCSDLSDAFHLQCVGDAQSASGTPDLNSSGFPAFSGSQFAHMYARFCPSEPGIANFHSEGILLNYNFVAGKPVKISFAVRSNGAPTETKLILVKEYMDNYGGHAPNVEPCSNTLDILPEIPAESETIATFAASAIPSSNWEVKTITITPSDDFVQLWFRIKKVSSNIHAVTASSLNIDNVCIEDLCPKLSYTVSTCRYPETNQVVVSINGSAVNPSDWALFTIPGCVPPLGNGVNISWLANNSSFLLPYNSGCYYLTGTCAPKAGCPAQRYSFTINTNGENVPICSGPCDDWHNSMTVKFCQEAEFKAIPDTYFPSGTQFTFVLDGATVQSGTNSTFTAPLSGPGHLSGGWHEMCLTVVQFGCPPIEKCYDFYIDCFEGPGGDRTGSENEQSASDSRSLMISNPSSGSIWMSIPFDEGSARLYSMQGALVKTFMLHGADQLDVSELAAGQYVLAIQTRELTVSKQVFIQN